MSNETVCLLCCGLPLNFNEAKRNGKKKQLISSRTVVNSHVNFMKLVPMLKFTLESGHIVFFSYNIMFTRLTP